MDSIRTQFITIVHDTADVLRGEWRGDIHDTAEVLRGEWQGTIHDTAEVLRGEWQVSIHDTAEVLRGEWRNEIHDSIVHLLENQLSCDNIKDCVSGQIHDSITQLLATQLSCDSIRDCVSGQISDSLKYYVHTSELNTAINNVINSRVATVLNDTNSDSLVTEKLLLSMNANVYDSIQQLKDTIAMLKTMITQYLITGEVSKEYPSATANQTTFNLGAGDPEPHQMFTIKIYVNGVRISNTAVSYSNRVFTYIPANNGGNTMKAGDRVVIDYYH